MPLPAQNLMRRWMVTLACVIVPLVCLAPFVSKPFHMDDPTYLWPAEQIHRHPLDFYGFSANWYGVEAPMSHMNKNPPLVSYYIALAAVLLGCSAKALHIVFLIPALAVSLGTYFLARSFCTRPHLAALAAVLTPAFLVSGTNVMCDTLMLAFYVWAAALWVHGLERDDSRLLVLAVVCISLAALTKYFGISLVPLLLAYSWAKNRSWERRFLAVSRSCAGFHCIRDVYLSSVRHGVAYRRGLVFRGHRSGHGMESSDQADHRLVFHRRLPRGGGLLRARYSGRGNGGD